MSLDALIWAVKDAPVKDVQEHAVLSVMADEADESGAGCLLGVPTIAERTTLSEREVRAVLTELLRRKLIGLGDQSRAAYIRADRRPKVYDLLIPYDAFSNVDRVNRALREKQRPLLTRESRPSIEPPPPKRRRADLGAKRAKSDGVTTSPAVHGVTSSPGGLQDLHGVTTKSVDGHLTLQVNQGVPAPRGEYQSPDPIDPVIDPPPPPPPAPPLTVPLDPPKTEEEEEPAGSTTPEAAQLLARVYGTLGVAELHRPRGRDAARLGIGVDQALRRGWQPGDLAVVLSAGTLQGVTTVYGAMAHRIRNLGDPPAVTAAIPPAAPRCDVCSDSRRVIVDRDDREVAVPCPECQPVLQLATSA